MNLYGFRDAVALRLLVEQYSTTQAFIDDAVSICHRVPPSAFPSGGLTAEDLKRMLVTGDESDFLRITEEWTGLWDNARAHLSKSAEKDVLELTETWGLRCKWGNGFILSCRHGALGGLLPTFIQKEPGRTDKASIEIYGMETRKQLMERIYQLAKEAEEKRQAKRNLWAERGYRTSIDESLIKAVDWLFLRITPPYLSPTEIAKSAGSDYIQIQRAYQKVARLLGIKLTKGWIKGHKRTFDRRLINEISTKNTLK